MDTIADFISQKDRIAKLEMTIQTQTSLKNKAIKSRDKERSKVVKMVEMLICVCKSGKCSLTNQEIADLCFVTLKSVIDARGRLKRRGL